MAVSSDQSEILKNSDCRGGGLPLWVLSHDLLLKAWKKRTRPQANAHSEAASSKLVFNGKSKQDNVERKRAAVSYEAAALSVCGGFRRIVAIPSAWGKRTMFYSHISPYKFRWGQYKREKLLFWFDSPFICIFRSAFIYITWQKNKDIYLINQKGKTTAFILFTGTFNDPAGGVRFIQAEFFLQASHIGGSFFLSMLRIWMKPNGIVEKRRRKGLIRVGSK